MKSVSGYQKHPVPGVGQVGKRNKNFVGNRDQAVQVKRAKEVISGSG